MNYSEIIIKAEVRARELYEKNLNPILVYHNIEHVENMVKTATEIANYYRLEIEDNAAVHVASWFHDTGYLFVKNNHEEKSTELAESFLNEEKSDPVLTGKVRECIMATRIFSVSSSLIAKIVSDADLFHLGTNDFWRNDQKMREESELRIGKKISADKWQKAALHLMERHRFHTDYCQSRLQKGKEENIRLLKMQLERNTKKDRNHDLS